MSSQLIYADINQYPLECDAPVTILRKPRLINGIYRGTANGNGQQHIGSRVIDGIPCEELI